MGLATAEQLLKPVPLKDETHDVEGIGKIRIVQLSFAETAKFSMWLYADGDKPSPKRQQNYGLKKATECLRNEKGEKLFDFPDTKEGNKAFEDFAKPIMEGGTGHWSEIIRLVHELNSEEDEGDVLGKSSNS